VLTLPFFNLNEEDDINDYATSTRDIDCLKSIAGGL
jgi:IS5 family transposase